MSKSLFFLFLSLACACVAAPQPGIRAVLVTQNHVQGEYTDSMTGIQDALAGELSARGFAVINPNNAVGTRQNRMPAGEEMTASSAVELCRLLNADCLITASVTEVTRTAIGNPPIAGVLNVRMTVNVADGTDGAVVASATVRTRSRQLTNAQFANSGSAIYTELVHDTATECAEAVGQRMSGMRFQSRDTGMARVAFTCNMQGADIKVDGAAMGTCPGTVAVRPGLHNIEVAYPFCLPYAAQAFFQDGQTYTIALQLNEEGRKRWKNTELFSATLDRLRATGATDDQVRLALADGTSQFWKNSGVKITDGSVQNLMLSPPGNSSSAIVQPPTPGVVTPDGIVIPPQPGNAVIDSRPLPNGPTVNQLMEQAQRL